MEIKKLLVLKFRKTDGNLYTLNIPDPVEPVEAGDIKELADHMIANDVVKFANDVTLASLEKAFVQQVEKVDVELR